MPAYELCVVLKSIPRPELAAALKRVGKLLMGCGAQIQKLENHGTKDLPYTFLIREERFTKGSYFAYQFISDRRIHTEVNNECSRDIDIIRHHMAEAYRDIKEPCTLHEEMKPPAERKSVQDLLEKGKGRRFRTEMVYRHAREYEKFDPYM